MITKNHASKNLKNENMKKAVLISMALLTIITCYSQTKKGNNFLGGQISLHGNTNSNLDTSYKSDIKSFGLQLNPGYGHFIKDNFAIGFNLNFGISDETRKSEYPNQIPSKREIKSNLISYGIGGFTRYYKKIVDKFYFYLNGEVSYTYQIEKMVNSNNDPNYVFTTYYPANQNVQTNIISIQIAPGVVYFVTSKLGI